MPKLGCACGNVIDLTQAPSPEEFLLVSERAVDAAADLVESGSADRETFLEVLDRGGRDVVECPKCSRLYIRPNRAVATYVVYVPAGSTDEAWRAAHRKP